MAYLARSAVIWDGASFHVTWQCHNQSWLLQYAWVKQLYYDLLVKYKDKYRVSFHSYHLMDNHIHLSGTILGTREEFSLLFKTVNSCLAHAINRQLGRRGQVVMDRFKSPVIQDDQALLAVMTYHDLNSYRARMVSHPKDYRWSSYHFYAHGKKDPLITPPGCYIEMGDTDEKRQATYRQFVANILANGGVQKKNHSTVCFIGDPDWVLKRNLELRAVMQAKREAYLLRQRRFLQQAPP